MRTRLASLLRRWADRLDGGATWSVRLLASGPIDVQRLNRQIPPTRGLR